MTLRRSFKVAVNSLESTEKSRGSSTNFLMLSYWASLELISTTLSLEKLLHCAMYDEVIDVDVIDMLHLGKFQKSLHVRHDQGYEIRFAVSVGEDEEMYLSILNSFSIDCGAMFLPPAVMMSSFLRSVM